MYQSIELRKAVIDDVEKIKSILLRALREYKIELPDNYPVDDIDSIGLKTSCAQVFVLVSENAVIGFTVLIPMADQCIELKRLYLAASARGQGLGRYLLNYAIEHAARNNYNCIRLETTSRFKEAVALYVRNGFTELDDVDKAPGHDLAYEKRL